MENNLKSQQNALQTITFYNDGDKKYSAEKCCKTINSEEYDDEEAPIQEQLSVFNQSNSIKKENENDTPYFNDKPRMNLVSVNGAVLSGFGTRNNMVNSECFMSGMDKTACFKKESKLSCVSQGENETACQIITESLDTDTTSMHMGEGLSCSLSRSGLGAGKQAYAMETFFDQSQHN